MDYTEGYAESALKRATPGPWGWSLTENGRGVVQQQATGAVVARDVSGDDYSLMANARRLLDLVAKQRERIEALERERLVAAQDAGLTQDDAESTHPGFTIVCHRCGSKKVYVENSMGYSPESGSWGSVDLACGDCKNSVEIIST